MLTVTTIADLRAVVSAWHHAGQSVVLVPTMGNLHDGHLSLARLARNLGDRVVASIFVNPLQFGVGEDFDSYPRTLDDDCALLEQADCDLAYAPAAEEMYPSGEPRTRVEAGKLGQTLCGSYRQGHFDGMATVVVKLFNQVLPDIAVFGQKDYQQLAIIRQVVSDLDIPVTVHGAPTMRDEDGLAMSSRNRYLTTEQRQIAPLLYRLLIGIAHELAAGNRDFGLLCDKAMQGLGDAGFAPDYVEIRTPDLGQPQLQDREFVILGAARLGKARLIDNVIVSA